MSLILSSHGMLKESQIPKMGTVPIDDACGASGTNGEQLSAELQQLLSLPPLLFGSDLERVGGSFSITRLLGIWNFTTG